MRLEIITKNKSRHWNPLRTVWHQGTNYAVAQTEGEYKIRLHNDSPMRRMVAVSVDGINVVDGTDAGYNGGSYVMRPGEVLDIPGWRRSDNTVANFQFSEQGGSYASQTGRGTSNVGIIGVAVFDEKVLTYVAPLRYTTTRGTTPYWNNLPVNLCSENDQASTRTSTSLYGEPYGCDNIEVSRGRSRSISPQSMTKGIPEKEERTSGGIGIFNMAEVKDVGTAYGRETTFITKTTSFTPATTLPAVVLEMRYATRERLITWGVPVDAPPVKAPSAFPASQPSVPAPAGWRG